MHDGPIGDAQGGEQIKIVGVSELISVEEVAFPVEKLRPPEDYREVPFELSRHFGSTPSPLPVPKKRQPEYYGRLIRGKDT